MIVATLTDTAALPVARRDANLRRMQTLAEHETAYLALREFSGVLPVADERLIPDLLNASGDLLAEFAGDLPAAADDLADWCRQSVDPLRRGMFLHDAADAGIWSEDRPLKLAIAVLERLI